MSGILKESFIMLKTSCVRAFKKYLPLIGQAVLFLWVMLAGKKSLPFWGLFFGTFLMMFLSKYVDIVYKCVNHIQRSSFPLPDKKYVKEEDNVLLVEKEDMHSLFLYMRRLELFLEEEGYNFEKSVDKVQES